MPSVVLFGPVAFFISLLLIALPFLCYFTQTSHLFEVYPSNCDVSNFANESSWFTGEWVMIPAYGMCPEGAYSYHYVSGYAYHDCIAWSDKRKWVALDTENSENGYKTYMKKGAEVWKSAYSCLIAATIFLFIIPFTVVAVGSDEDEDGALSFCTAFFCVPIAFALTVVAYVTIQDTDQIIPDAWSETYFESCDITIKTASGLYILMFVASVCGIVVIFTISFISYLLYQDCMRKPVPAEAPSTNNNTGPSNSGTGGAESTTLLYGTAVIDRTTEIDPLLEDEESASRKRRGNKVYQTAVEYLGNRDYNLPHAAAATVRDDDVDTD